MENLMPMIDFVIYQYEKILNEEINHLDYAFNTCIYARFLKKHLKLGYFIPCDENDVALEEPKHYDLWKKHGSFTQYGESIVSECSKFHEAKQRVLFEGFEYEYENEWINYNGFSRFFISELQNGKIEDLHELITEKTKLTETAKKEIGL